MSSKWTGIAALTHRTKHYLWIPFASKYNFGDNHNAVNALWCTLKKWQASRWREGQKCGCAQLAGRGRPGSVCCKPGVQGRMGQRVRRECALPHKSFLSSQTGSPESSSTSSPSHSVCLQVGFTGPLEIVYTGLHLQRHPPDKGDMNEKCLYAFILPSQIP